MVRGERGTFLLALCSKDGKMYNKQWSIIEKSTFIVQPNLTCFYSAQICTSGIFIIFVSCARKEIFIKLVFGLPKSA